ncbi:MAG: TetR/AcrR family transcriptional regulator [Acidobacteria bacterium]|nr:TetR/AcrR family transcriptional regulator [Acidobacteriota bacterium]
MMKDPSTKRRTVSRVVQLASDEKTLQRRAAITAAALDCFLQYGYEKTTLEDIATRAGLSRTLLYLHFRNKEEIFIETTRSLYREQFAKAWPVLTLPISRKEKLLRIYDELLVKPWIRICKSPGYENYLAACHSLSPQLDHEYEREATKLLLPLLGDKSVIEVFLLCIDGLYSDDPSPATLRKRIRILVERFQ